MAMAGAVVSTTWVMRTLYSSPWSPIRDSRPRNAMPRMSGGIRIGSTMVTASKVRPGKTKRFTA